MLQTSNSALHPTTGKRQQQTITRAEQLLTRGCSGSEAVEVTERETSGRLYQGTGQFPESSEVCSAEGERCN